MKLPAILAMSLVMITAAQASFDLVFVMDLTARKIHRLDGGTGVYLGSIDGISTQSISMSVDSATGRVYVAEGLLGFSVYNGYTGTLVGSNMGPYALNASYGLSNDFVYGTAGSIYSYADPSQNPFASADLITTVPNGSIGTSNIEAVARVGQTLHALDDTNKRLVTFDLSDPSSQTYLPLANVGHGNRLAIDGDLVYSIRPSGGILTQASFSGLAPTGTTAINLSGGGLPFLQVNSIAAGHLGTQYLVGSTTSGGQVMRTNRNAAGALYSRRTYNVPGLQTASDVAVLIAPEPGSMIALAGGMAVLLRRRRFKRP